MNGKLVPIAIGVAIGYFLLPMAVNLVKNR